MNHWLLLRNSSMMESWSGRDGGWECYHWQAVSTTMTLPTPTEVRTYVDA